MKVTHQQLLILFDIVKGCLYSSETQFAGYSKEDIMKLLNEIISQQDNNELLNIEPKSLDNIGKIDISKIKDKDNFWDEN